MILWRFLCRQCLGTLSRNANWAVWCPRSSLGDQFIPQTGHESSAFYGFFRRRESARHRLSLHNALTPTQSIAQMPALFASASGINNLTNFHSRTKSIVCFKWIRPDFRFSLFNFSGRSRALWSGRWPFCTAFDVDSPRGHSFRGIAVDFLMRHLVFLVGRSGVSIRRRMSAALTSTISDEKFTKLTAVLNAVPTLLAWRLGRAGGDERWESWSVNLYCLTWCRLRRSLFWVSFHILFRSWKNIDNNFRFRARHEVNFHHFIDFCALFVFVSLFSRRPTTFAVVATLLKS